MKFTIMRTARILHWVFTLLLSALLFMSASMYFLQPDEVAVEFTIFGFPTWIIYPLAIAKFLGVVMIITKWKKWLTEWAYAGIFFNVSLAIGAHFTIQDGDQIVAIVGLILMVGSFATWKIREKA